MKTWKQGFIGLLVIFTLSLVFTACDDKGDDKEVPVVLQPTEKTVTFGKITVSSPDQRTPSEWDTVLGTLVSALNTAYAGADDTYDYDEVVKEAGGIKIVLDNNLPKNWEVKAGAKYGTLYIKTGSISSMTAEDYERAMISVGTNSNFSSLTKANPTKNVGQRMVSVTEFASLAARGVSHRICVV